jgi:hypothetical protein
LQISALEHTHQKNSGGILTKIYRALVLSLFALAVSWASCFAILDQPAAQTVNAGMKRALISFATARGLSAVISVVQGTQLSAQPMGIGVTLTPGQLLAPVNNVVGHFANLMLVATVALGVERVMIEIGSYWAVSLGLTLIVVAWAGLAIRRRTFAPSLTRLLLVLLLVRFAVPVSVISSEWIWQHFLDRDYIASQAAIQSATVSADRLNAAPATTDSNGVVDRFKFWLSRNTDLKVRFEELKLAAESATEHIVKLMVIFLLQTLIFPILVLWILYTGLGSILRGPERVWLSRSGETPPS